MNTRNLMEIAYWAHMSQVDKGGSPYILHPWTVSLILYKKVVALSVFRGVDKQTIEYVEQACIGHDLVEDTAITLEDLRSKGVAEPVLHAIYLLTHNKTKNTYKEFILKCMQDKVAHMAKICDIVDNCDKRRISDFSNNPWNLKRLERYKESLLLLGVAESEMVELLTY